MEPKSIIATAQQLILDGNLSELESLLHQALWTKSDLQTLLDLGVIAHRAGLLHTSEQIFQEAVNQFPESSEARFNLGLCYISLGQLVRCCECFQEASDMYPNSFDLHYRIGRILQHHNQWQNAEVPLRRAVQLDPHSINAVRALGEVLFGLHRREEALSMLQSLFLWPIRDAKFWHGLGKSLQHNRCPDLALDAFERSYAINSELFDVIGALLFASLHCCAWDKLPELTARVVSAIDTGSDCVPPSALLLLHTTPAQQLSCARQWVARCYPPAIGAMSARAKPASAFSRHVSTAPRSRIKVGYLSSDFYDHATTRLMVELIEKHDRHQFEVFGYSYSESYPSPMRDRIVSAFDQWVEQRDWSSNDIADRISADSIDILVDLKGHTGGTRFDILARRPAPIQAHFLGFPGTTGADYVDYLIVDHDVIPVNHQPFFSECLVRLPGCYQPNDSQRVHPADASRQQFGLSDDEVVFCCFNNNYKITPVLFEAWMDILRQVPGSRLWLLEDNPRARQNLIARTMRAGLDERCLLFAPRRPYSEYLSRFSCADLFLDTFPVCAHTTASDSLWMGCPLLTIAGETFVSRVSASLLTACGLPRLIVRTIDEYAGLAVCLGQDKQQLAAMRTLLEQRRCELPLFRGADICRHLENAYLQMVERHRRGEPPQPMDLSTD